MRAGGLDLTPINADLTTELLHRAVTLTEAGAIDEDVYCLGCGYNLRSLAATGTCPECGALIAGTLEFGNIARFDPEWVASLRQFTDFLDECIRKYLKWGLWAYFAVWWFFGREWPVKIVVVCGTLLALISAWRITASPGRTLLPERTHFLRRLTRVSLLASIFCLVVGGAFFLCFRPLPLILTVHLLMTASPFGLAGSVFAISLASYQRHMAILFNDGISLRQSTTYRKWFVRFCVCSALGWLLTSFGLIAYGEALIFVGQVGEGAFYILILSGSMGIGSMARGRREDFFERQESDSPTEVADAGS